MSFLVPRWCLGNTRNRTKYQNLHLRLNIELLQPLLVRFNGWRTCLRNFTFLSFLLLLYTATTNQPSILPTFPPSTNTQNTKIDCDVIREKINNGLIHLLPITSTDQLADLFTKPLFPSAFHKCISKLGLTGSHSPT